MVVKVKVAPGASKASTAATDGRKSMFVWPCDNR